MMENQNNDICPICTEGTIEATESVCPFCNGTKEYTSSAGAYLKNHICQCIWEPKRKTCPICKKKCHHNSQQTSKILISPSM